MLRIVKQSRWIGYGATIGLLLGMLSWGLDTAIASWLANQGTLLAQLLHPAPVDLLTRTISLLLFVGAGVAVDFYRVRNHAGAADEGAGKSIIDSEARLRRYYDAGLIGMAIVAPDRRLLQCNDKYCEITGYHREELLAMKFTDITHPDDVDNGLGLFEQAKSRKIDGFELNKRYMRKDGRIIDVVVSSKFVYTADGSMSYSVAFVQDVTERKRAERQLRQSEERLREAQRIARLGFWQWDLVKDELFWSDELFTILGLSQEQFNVTSESLHNLIHPEDRTDFYEHFNTVLETGIPLKHEHRIILPNGEMRYHRVQGEVIRETSGLPIVMFGTVLDITEQKLADRTSLLYEHIVNASTDAMAIVDTNYQYLAVNQHYLEAFKIDRNDVIGRHMQLIIGADNFTRFAKHNIDKALTGVSSNMQGWTYQPGFGKRYLDIYDTPLRDAKGKVFGVVINAHDITERKLAEDELQRSEELLRRYYEAGSVGMALSSPDKGFFQFNDSFCDIVGYPRNAISNISWQEITHPEDQGSDAVEYARVMSGEIDSYTLDNRVIRGDGGLVYLTTAVNCARKQDGSIDYLVTFVQDITERKLAEQALRKSEDLITKALQTTTDSVSITRLRDGMILFANRGFTTLTGYSEEEWRGQTSIDLNIWREPVERERMLQGLKTGGIRNFEMEAVIKGGEVIPVIISSSLVEMEGEDCIVSWIRDIRETKRAEQERWKLEQQLFRSQKMEAIGQLTGGIAHDFNNILASILGYSNLIKRRSVKLDDPKLAEYIKEVIHGGERARDLIRQMMMYSRSVPSEVTSQPLQPLVENAIKLLRPMLPSNIEIRSRLPANIPDVTIDPAQFEQIIMNLCINARDAINGSGSIDLELYVASLGGHECASCHGVLAGDFVVMSVRDTGGGIDEKIVPLIFDPFYTTKEVGRGTGMGLSMIHGIVHNGGGHILLDTTVGDGSKFSVLFPLALINLEKNDILNLKEPESRYSTSKKQGVIMVVDDEPSIASYLGELLESHGYQTIVMTSSETALRRFQADAGHIDLVITDQTMPGLTGMELASEFLSRRADVPIILSTGYSEHVNEETARDAGIKAYLTKPVNETFLLHKLDELLVNIPDGNVVRAMHTVM